MLGAHLDAGTAAQTIRGLQRKAAASHQIAGERGTHIDTLATRRALVKITLRRAHLHVLGKLGVVLQRREHQLAPVREQTATFGRRGAAHGVERTLELRDLMAMGFELLRHRGQCRRCRIELCHGKARGAGDLFHVLLALVLAALMALEALGIDLQTHARARPLLGGSNGLAQDVLATGVTALIAHAQRQVHAHIGIIGQHREPGLGRNIAHTGNDDLVLARHALKSTRAGNVGGLMTRSSRDDIVIQVFGRQARRDDRLGRTGSGAQAALATGVEDLDGVFLDLDGVDRAHVHARGAAALLVFAGQARNGVSARTLLVVGRIPLRRRRIECIGHTAKRVFKKVETLADLDNVIKQIVFLRHARPLPEQCKQARDNDTPSVHASGKLHAEHLCGK